MSRLSDGLMRKAAQASGAVDPGKQSTRADGWIKVEAPMTGLTGKRSYSVEPTPMGALTAKQVLTPEYGSSEALNESRQDAQKYIEDTGIKSTINVEGFNNYLGDEQVPVHRMADAPAHAAYAPGGTSGQGSPQVWINAEQGLTPAPRSLRHEFRHHIQNNYGTLFGFGRQPPQGLRSSDNGFHLQTAEERGYRDAFNQGVSDKYKKDADEQDVRLGSMKAYAYRSGNRIRNAEEAKNWLRKLYSQHEAGTIPQEVYNQHDLSMLQWLQDMKPEDRAMAIDQFSNVMPATVSAQGVYSDRNSKTGSEGVRMSNKIGRILELLSAVAPMAKTAQTAVQQIDLNSLVGGGSANTTPPPKTVTTANTTPPPKPNSFTQNPEGLVIEDSNTVQAEKQRKAITQQLDAINAEGAVASNRRAAEVAPRIATAPTHADYTGAAGIAKAPEVSMPSFNSSEAHKARQASKTQATTDARRSAIRVGQNSDVSYNSALATQNARRESLQAQADAAAVKRSAQAKANPTKTPQQQAERNANIDAQTKKQVEADPSLKSTTPNLYANRQQAVAANKTPDKFKRGVERKPGSTDSSPTPVSGNKSFARAEKPVKAGKPVKADGGFRPYSFNGQQITSKEMEDEVVFGKKPTNIAKNEAAELFRASLLDMAIRGLRVRQ